MLGDAGLRRRDAIAMPSQPTGRAVPCRLPLCGMPSRDACRSHRFRASAQSRTRLRGLGQRGLPLLRVLPVEGSGARRPRERCSASRKSQPFPSLIGERWIEAYSDEAGYAPMFLSSCQVRVTLIFPPDTCRATDRESLPYRGCFRQRVWGIAGCICPRACSLQRRAPRWGCHRRRVR